MKWFEKHINWTMIFITIVGSIITCLLTLFALGFNWIERLSQIPYECSFYLPLGIATSTLATVTCMLWIVTKKNGSILIALLFCSSLSFSPALFVLTKGIEYWAYESTNLLRIILIINAILWGIGIIILLVTKKRTSGDNSLDIKSEKQTRKLNRQYIVVMISSLILACIFSFVSFFYMCIEDRRIYMFSAIPDSDNNSNVIYDILHIDSNNGFFEVWYSDSSINSIFNYYIQNKNYRDDFIYQRSKIRPFETIDSFLEIHLYPDKDYKGISENSTLIEKCIYLTFGDDRIASNTFSEPVYDSDYADPIPIPELQFEMIEINSHPAEYSTFVVRDKYKDIEYNVQFACFKKINSYICVILLLEEEVTDSKDEFISMLMSFGDTLY